MAKVLRERKQGELTIKDMSVLRETESAKTVHKKTFGYLKEYSNNHVVAMRWGHKESVRKLLPFNLIIDGRPFLLSWAELKDMDRGGFFRREEGNPRSYVPHVFNRDLTFDVDLNEEAERDMIFRITGKNIEAYLDWYEVLRLGRFV